MKKDSSVKEHIAMQHFKLCLSNKTFKCSKIITVTLHVNQSSFKHFATARNAYY